MPTCGVCGDLEPDRSSVGDDRRWCHGHELSQSAERGCHTCSLIYNGLLFYEKGLADERPGVSRRPRISIDAEVGFPLDVSYWYEPLSLTSYEFYVHEGESSPSSYLGVGRRVARNLDVDHAVRLARGWLKECAEKHPVCVPSTAPHLPTRVVDVGLHGQTPRLIESNGNVASYAALSYCWGTRGNLTTTKSMYNQRTAGIPWDALPKTFKDAITFTKELGLRYLWIDALCIIQGDPLDWARESAKMASVFEGAFVVLSVTGSANVFGGFLGMRSGPDSKYSAHELTCPGPTEIHTVYARPAFSHGPFVELDSYDDSYEEFEKKFPLLSRAWAFQERLLARRTVHLSPDELVWEYRSKLWCECMSIRGYEEWSSEKRAARKVSAFREAMKMKVPAAFDLHTLWQSLIRPYTQRQLTVSSDKLPALSGIASQFQKLGVGTYLAGLWTEHLPYYLMWQRHLGTSSTRIMRPSWSWTSISGWAYWFMDFSDCQSLGFEADVDILYAGCELETTDPLGRVSSGKITLSARTIPAVLCEIPPRQIEVDFFILENDGETHAFYPDVFQFESEEDHSRSPEEKDRLVIGDSVVCVQILVSRKKTWWRALVLKQSAEVDHAYQRVGIIDYTGHEICREELGEFEWKKGDKGRDWFKNVEKSTITIV